MAEALHAIIALAVLVRDVARQLREQDDLPAQGQRQVLSHGRFSAERTPLEAFPACLASGESYQGRKRVRCMRAIARMIADRPKIFAICETPSGMGPVNRLYANRLPKRSGKNAPIFHLQSLSKAAQGCVCRARPKFA